MFSLVKRSVNDSSCESRKVTELRKHISGQSYCGLECNWLARKRQVICAPVVCLTFVLKVPAQHRVPICRPLPLVRASADICNPPLSIVPRPRHLVNVASLHSFRASRCSLRWPFKIGCYASEQGRRRTASRDTIFCVIRSGGQGQADRSSLM